MVVREQQKFLEKSERKPIFVGCQHHILDRILRLVMDESFGSPTISPDIEYPFVKILDRDYEKLKSQFNNGAVIIEENFGWREEISVSFSQSISIL